MPPVAGAAKGLILRNPRIQRSSNAVHSELKALATRVISQLNYASVVMPFDNLARPARQIVSLHIIKMVKIHR
jgi:hypothetical protein